MKKYDLENMSDYVKITIIEKINKQLLKLESEYQSATGEEADKLYKKYLKLKDEGKKIYDSLKNK